MTRRLVTVSPAPHGQLLLAGEPIVGHCNFYNYWLQKTVLLARSLGMDSVIREAAAGVAHSFVQQASEELGLVDPEDRLGLASDTFAQNGFGTIDFSDCSATGGLVKTPTSHYGQLLLPAAGLQRFSQPQNLFDQGYAIGALAAAFDLPATTFTVSDVQCFSVGDQKGEFVLSLQEESQSTFSLHSNPAESAIGVSPPNAATNVNEKAILEALAGLDFSGNEEGFIPRFDVMLTFHFANFYNRISFEFLHLMAEQGNQAQAEAVLVDAGHRCAFHTFGGIMKSAEWEAVIAPQCKTQLDWVHGIVACVNSLGWGVWRIHSVSETQLTMRIYDDYESRGYLSMYGQAERPVSFLAAGGVAGIMNLVMTGGIQSKPRLDDQYYDRVFESDKSFTSQCTRSLACGGPFTEIVASRAS